jgi:CubicO group peptidase (beta-lactamase class C family)
MKKRYPFKTILFIFISIILIIFLKEKIFNNESDKLGKNGIPVMHPLKQEMPKFSVSYCNEKKIQIDSFFHKVWNEEDNVSFLVAQNGRILYENYNGFANRSKKELITADAPLHIASVSKVLTSSAILMLVDAGKIKLEQKVTDFLPNFPYPDVTVLTLLNHRSGMKNYAYFTYDDGNWDRKKELSNEDIISVMNDKHIPLESKTDTRFGYCNTNYAMLALIIEKVTNLKYPEAMQEMIFKPLGMKHTFVYETAKHKGKVSLSYKGNMDLAVEYLDGVYGDKNIYSTPRDLLKFDMAKYSKCYLNPELIKNQLNKFLSTHKSWDTILVAGNNIPPYQPIDDTCIRVFTCQTTTGYLVNGHYFDTLIENIKTGIKKLMRFPDRHILYAIDKYWFQLQKEDKWYLIIPLSVTQREDYSDIEKRATNYSHVMLDLDKSAFSTFRKGGAKINL